MWAVHKLPVRFDPERLRADYHRITEGFHPYAPLSRDKDEGKWEGMPLVSVGRDTGPDGLRMGTRVYEQTPLLDQCPYFAEVIRTLHCEAARARLLRLKPGGIIPTHRDRHSSYYLGVICLHVPIETHPDVRMVVDGEAIYMAAGEVWYLDNSRAHSVSNRSDIERVHLVIDDCPLNDYLRSLFPAGVGRFYALRRLSAQVRYRLKVWRLKEAIWGR